MTLSLCQFEIVLESSFILHCRVALHQKKVSSLIGKLLKREVTLAEAGKTPKGKAEKVTLGAAEKTPLGEAEKDLLESTLSQMDKFREEVTRYISYSFCLVLLFVDKKISNPKIRMS